MTPVSASPQEGVKNGNKKRRLESHSFQIPVVRAFHDEAAIEEAYEKYQVLRIPKVAADESNNNSHSNILTWKGIGDLFESLKEDKDSWCVENGGKVQVSPLDFLQAKQTGYSSFLLQKNVEMLQNTLNRLPVCTLLENWYHGPCVWFFFGVNRSGEDLQGRPEHTDSVSHDGTWHYQLSGCKRWHLRPTEELLEKCPSVSSTVIDCQEGDVIVVNTRLWWHRTVVPSQSNPSVSFARDFYCTKPAEETTEQPQPMSNVDGLYAANNVEANTIIFTENDMPECELPHSTTNPNCEVVELEDGTSALVSIRLIRAGEFFCVAEDESEEEETDDDDDDDS